VKTILVATDFSTRADRAMRRATLLAKRRACRVVLLHVVDSDRPDRFVSHEYGFAEKLLRDLADTMQRIDGIKSEQRLVLGTPDEAIVRAAEEIDADLIVLGPHRRRPVGDMLTGTTVERVVRTSSRPVLVAVATPAREYRSVLLASDLSEGSAQAAAAAERLGLLGDAQTSVFHAFTAPAQNMMLQASTTSQALRDYIESRRAKAAQALARFLKRRNIGVQNRVVELIETSPAKLIEKCARQLEADLIVVGTTGRTGLRRLLIGSVAEEILGEATTDVLAVPATPYTI
jgi:nucleotide-binding universal stress UspA family protein